MKNIGTVIIETDRLLLRRFEIQDSDAVFENWASSENATKYLTWEPHKNICETRRLIRGWVDAYKDKKFYEWAVVLKDTNELIGSIDATPAFLTRTFEIGYCFGEKWLNCGYATEAVKSIMNFLFNRLSCKRIRAKCSVDNKASQRVLTKVGMTLKKKEIFIPAERGFITCNCYEIKC